MLQFSYKYKYKILIITRIKLDKNIDWNQVVQFYESFERVFHE